MENRAKEVGTSRRQNFASWVAGEKGERNCSDGNGEMLHISWVTGDIQAVYRKENTEKDCKKIWLK